MGIVVALMGAVAVLKATVLVVIIMAAVEVERWWVGLLVRTGLREGR